MSTRTGGTGSLRRRRAVIDQSVGGQRFPTESALHVRPATGVLEGQPDLGRWRVALSEAARLGSRLHDNTVMQSMASDGRYWIFAQIQQTGRFGLSHAQHEAAGDLTLTRISPTGEERGHMFLNGFGHGVSI